MGTAIRWSGARMVAVGAVVVLLAAWGSSGGGVPQGRPEAGTAQDAWIDTVPLLTIGDEAGDPLHRVSGAVLVGDTLIIAQSASLRFYDRRSGEFLLRAGRRGEGPGENRRIASLQRVGERLYTYDSISRRVTVWDLSGALERTVDIEYWAPYRSPVFDMTGTLVREIGPDPPPDPVRISREDRRRFADFDDIDRDDFPQFYPFYSRGSAVVGDAFWVLDYLDPERDVRVEWSVYSQEGEPLGRVTAEERLRILAVDGDVAVVVHYDGWNVETVQLRRIVNP